MSYLDAKKVVYLQEIYKELESLVKEIGTVEGASTTWDSITGSQSSVSLSGFTNDAGFITAESDPTFATSPAATITQPDIDSWNTSIQAGDNISLLTNDAGYISDTSNFVTLDGSQVITGQKTFSDGANIRVASNDDNTGGFQMLKEDGGLLNLGFEEDFLRWRRGGGGAFAGWRWDSFENTSLSLTGAGDATFAGDVVAGSTIAEITAGPANILTTKEWVLANSGGAGTWGSITGTLSDQTDLQAELDNRVTLDTPETITGVKTIASVMLFNNSAGISFTTGGQVVGNAENRLWFNHLNRFTFQPIGGFSASINSSNLSAARNYTLQDKAGTIALLDDIPNTVDFATAAQGALAGTATQPGDNVSTLTNDAGYITGTTGFTGSYVTATDTVTVVNGLITAVTPL